MRAIDDSKMTFEQVVQLAFPGPHEPNVVFSMTYRHAASIPHAGELGPCRVPKTVRRSQLAALPSRSSIPVARIAARFRKQRQLVPSQVCRATMRSASMSLSVASFNSFRAAAGMPETIGSCGPIGAMPEAVTAS